MSEKIKEVTLEMLRPGAENRSKMTNFRMAQFMRNYLGRGRIEFYRGIRDGSILPEHIEDGIAGEINEHVLQSIPTMYHLTRKVDPQEFYVQRQLDAIRIVLYYGERVPEAARSMDLKEEIKELSDEPSDLISLIAKPVSGNDPVLEYEVQRHIILAHMSGIINARTLNGRLRTRLSKALKRFNKELFEGPRAAGKPVTVESIHDDDTNTVVGLYHEGQKIPRTAHLKRIPFVARRIKDLGMVQISGRKKDDRVAGVKSLAKALNNEEGRVDIPKDVHDGIGMEWVSLEKSVTPQALAERVVSVTVSDPKFKVIEVKNEDKNDMDHGQSPDFNHVCRQIWFKGIPLPLEYTFFDLENYINSKLEVGKRDPDTGLYMGRAHELFELRRAYRTLHIVFPPEVYPLESIYEAFVRRSIFTAIDLKQMHRGR